MNSNLLKTVLRLIFQMLCPRITFYTEESQFYAANQSVTAKSSHFSENDSESASVKNTTLFKSKISRCDLQGLLAYQSTCELEVVQTKIT